MNSRLCKKLGIELPLFAFLHCRYVVAEKTNAGGCATSPKRWSGSPPRLSKRRPRRHARSAMTNRSGIIRGVFA